MKYIDSISFEGLSFSHIEGNTLIDKADFFFQSGNNYLIESESGGGKSSILKIIAGLAHPQKGKLLFNNINVLDLTFEEFLPLRLKVGYSFDYGGLIHNLTLLDNLVLPIVYHQLMSEDSAREKVMSLFKQFEMAKFANERPSSAPGRIRKLACILRPLVMEPEVLILDEPTLGLSNDNLFQFIDYVNGLLEKKTHTVFFTTQDERFKRSFEHRQVVLSEGLLYENNVEPLKKVAHF